MQNPLVSIIIPTFNRAHLIGETLDSVLAQTYTNWECIVVDDGSNDYTDELLEFYCARDSRIKYSHRPKDRRKGANACRNYGFVISEGAWLIFLDSDDLLESFSVKNRVLFSKQREDDFFLVFEMKYFRKIKGDLKKVVNSYSKNKTDYLARFLKYDLPWQITSLLINKEKVKVRFDERLMRLQDVDFNIRLLMEAEEMFTVKKGAVDCYYRKELQYKNQNHSDKFIEILIESYLTYFDSIHHKIQVNKNYKVLMQCHKIFFLKFYKIFLLPNIRKNFLNSWKLKNVLIRYGYIHSSFLLKLILLDFYHFFNLQSYSRTGAYRLTKRWLG